jgi:hypothetical protein
MIALHEHERLIGREHGRRDFRLGASDAVALSAVLCAHRHWNGTYECRTEHQRFRK